LIGINRTVVGRFSENFTNKQAREALLYLLKYDDIGDEVMSLLLRDPWQSDIPKLFEIMESTKTDNWYIIDALSHYNLLAKLPILQPIPAQISSITFNFPYDDPTTLERNYDFEKQLHGVLRSIKSLNNPNINIESSLFDVELWGITRHKIAGKWISKDAWGTSIEEFIKDIFPVENSIFKMFDFGQVGNKIQYYTENSKLYICSPMTAKKRLLTWLNKQPNDYRQQFTQNKAAR